MGKLKGRKTYIVGTLGVVGALASYLVEIGRAHV